jgi:hypothetical protein
MILTFQGFAELTDQAVLLTTPILRLILFRHAVSGPRSVAALKEG